MSDIHVPRGATVKLGRVEGELKVGHKARIEATEGNLVSVSGGAYFEGAAEIEGDFECDSLRVSSGGVLEVEGDLTVHKLLDVNHSVEVTGTIRAGEIDVGGKVEAKSLSCRQMRVGGKVEVRDKLEVETLTVGGKVKVPGSITIRDFDVGGQAELGSGTISGEIHVGGKFVCSSKIEFGNMQVFGQTSLGAGSKGNRISTSGRLEVSGDFECNEMEILGKTEIGGNCKAKKIKVNGVLKVNSSLQTTELLEINGGAEIRRDLQGSDIRLGGKLEARKVVASNLIEVIGVVETSLGMKAKTIEVRSGSRVVGPIIADQVEIGSSYGVVLDWEKQWMGQLATMRLVGRMTKVEDIYADTVRLGKVSNSEKVFARVVEIEDGCIAEEINYTEELKGNLDRVHIEKPPVKEDRLEAPPI
jgi:cytoskeletal protein CcmA (bactofilin family)